MASEQDVDMLVMENELIKRDMKDMEDRVKVEIVVDLPDCGPHGFLAKGNGQNNNGNGAAEMSGLEEKQASAATPARQNLYGAKDTQTPAANASNGGTNPGGVPEMLLSLIKRLPVDQRTAL